MFNEIRHHSPCARAAYRVIPNNADCPLLVSSHESQEGMGWRQNRRTGMIPRPTLPDRWKMAGPWPVLSTDFVAAVTTMSADEYRYSQASSRHNPLAGLVMDCIGNVL
jgi:hypothetical protein